ncbi:MAG: hypothetical protein LC624_07705 [Halobacteriales archaeon]|nr:hypothetical protein [Halobacteriales archaeon]
MLRLAPVLLATVLLAAPVLAVVPGVVPVSPIPVLDEVRNGEFEAGLAGWSIPLTGSPIRVVSPGGDAHGQVLSVPALVPSPRSNGNWVEQRVQPYDVPELVFQVRAYVASGARPGYQVAEAISNWNPAGSCLSGGCRYTASLAFTQGSVSAAIMDGGAGLSAPVPSRDAWHTYTIVWVPVVGIGAFLIDDVPQAGVLQGVPAYTEPAEWIAVGDGAQGAGQGSDMMFDDVSYGPALDLPAGP